MLAILTRLALTVALIYVVWSVAKKLKGQEI